MNVPSNPFQSDEEFDEPNEALVSVLKGAGLDPDLLSKTVVKKRSPHKKFKSDADFFRKSDSPEGEGARRDLFNSQRVRAVMTRDICDTLHPDVPHEWMCDGRLLLLTDPANQKNYDLFKVGKKCMDMYEIDWHSDAFTYLLSNVLKMF